jgi:two-component sensor histidine kinase
MGMRLIEGIVAQLDGNYRYIKGNGTRFEAELALSRTARATVGAPSSM